VIDEVVCEQRVEECEITTALHLFGVGANDRFGGLIVGRSVGHIHETPHRLRREPMLADRAS